MDQEKLKEVLSDEAFVKELLDMEEPEQVQKALEDKGVSVSTQEIRRFAEYLRKVQGGEVSEEKSEDMADGELPEDELAEVAGGMTREEFDAEVLRKTGINLGELRARTSW